MLPIALAGLPVVAVAAGVLSLWGRGPWTRGGRATLVVRLGVGPDPNAVLGGPLSKHLREFRLVSAGTARQGAALELANWDDHGMI